MERWRRAAGLFGHASGLKTRGSPWRAGRKRRPGHDLENRLSPSVWNGKTPKLRCMYVLSEGHGGTEGKRHGGARRRAAWLFGLAFGPKTMGSPWRTGRKMRFGHDPENKLSPSVWKGTEANMYVLGEGHGGTEGKRHGGARRRAAGLFGLASGLKTRGSPWRTGRKLRLGHDLENKLSPSVWNGKTPKLRCLYVLSEGHGGTEGKRHGGTRRRAAWLFGLASWLKTRCSPWRTGRKLRLGHELENKLSPSVWKDTEPKVYVFGEGHSGTEGKRHGGTRRTEAPARRRAATGGRDVRPCVWAENEVFAMARGPKTTVRPRSENGLSPSVWKDTEPKVHVWSEGQGGTEGKREEARGDGRHGCSALRLG
jgi:hypothetical protein